MAEPLTGMTENLIAHRFRESVLDSPHKQILSDAGSHLTFEELDLATDSLACRIGEVLDTSSPQDILPLIVNRSQNSVIAIYAALKLGVGFALIDSENTQDFIDSALIKLGNPAVVVITDSQQGVKVDAPTVLEAESRILQRREEVEPRLVQHVIPTKIAVILFTSGTSGEAKGVMYSWGTLNEVFARNLIQLANDDKHARCVNFASFGFLAGLLRTLLIAEGVSVAIVDPRATNAGDLLTELKKERLTVISMTPSLAQAFNTLHDAVDLLPTVKVIYTYGESIIGRELMQIRRLVNSRARIVHRYDASEAPGGIFRFEIEGGADIPTHHVPMGKEISPGRVALKPVAGYDDDLREIVVKDLVAQGYLGQPELTAERFGVDEEGVPFWKSGDLVRVGENGDLIHEGRIDNLVKVNGKVVSTRFVETSLLTISGIRHAAVVAERKLNGRYSLTAHVEIDPQLNMSQDFIKDKLIALGLTTAVPRKIFRHDKLPLTNRGKVDYKTLREQPWPAWHDTRTVPPSQDLQRSLKEKIARILSLPDIDIDQDLWKVGFDSLGAIELSVIISGMGFLNVQPTDFAEYSTVRSLATYLESIAVGGGATTFTFNPGGTEKPIFVLLPAGQSPLIFHGLADLLGPKQPIVAITSIDFSAEHLRLRTIEKIAENHLETVRKIQPEGPLNLVGYCFGAIVAYDMAQQDKQKGGTPKVTMLDSWFPSLHLDGLHPTAPVAALVARQFRKTPKAIVESTYYRSLATYYRATGKIPPNVAQSKNFLLKLLSYSWYKIADRYTPRPATFPLAYIEGNEGQVIKDLDRLVPADLRTLRQVNAVHANVLDKSALPVIAEVILSQKQKAEPLPDR